uniref:Uncharacterized protein n=1 Tax=Avena sativa TaxID=4498 RepID=A0ACD5VVK4_AVESA
MRAPSPLPRLRRRRILLAPGLSPALRLLRLPGLRAVVRTMSSNTEGAKSHARRDLLLKIQLDAQTCWEEGKVFQAEPGNKVPGPGEKFFGNFPYPYMNGLLHLGHAFSLSKLEFGAAYHRLRGSNVLLPFGFHCTGMPIKASADKLAREIQQYGNPPVFPAAEDDSSPEVADDSQVDQAAAVAPDKFKSKKSKAAAKTGLQKFQWEIMRGFGLSDEEIAKFQDPSHWLTYFPPLAKEDLKAFGLGCDWRRSFITTDMNPFYDAFWYITYGETEWKQKAVKCLENMNTFSAETRNGFEHTLGWLNQWACSRSFGLGTRIPWDEQFLVESLSDSTLYMAYYTIAHLLQNGNMYGQEVSSVKPEEMTDEVWEYVFCDGPAPKSDISPALLSRMKQEFEYWYPFDIRVSGKDLIQNHLTFSIYNHTALVPEHHWPRGFRCNGHLMLNSEKMSKSTGNFRTLKQAIEEFSSDATRFALADAGDGMDDANFVFETANAAILRLTKEIAWMEEVIAAESSLRGGPPSTYADNVFANEINIAVQETEKSYNAFMFRDALKSGFYDLQLARDEYRLSCGSAGMNRELLGRFMEVQTRLITPICPHYAEHVWQKILKKEGFAIKAGWPVAGTPDPTLRSANKYLQDSIVLMRKLLQKQESGSKKPKKGAAPPPAESKLTVGLIYVNEHYDGWKEQCLRVLQSNFDSQARSFAPDEEINEALKNCFIDRETNFKQVQKLCMPFIRFKKDEARNVGPQALNLKLPFGEIDVLEENLELIRRQLGLEHVEVLSAFDGAARAKAGRHGPVLDKNPPSPGEPVAIFMSKEEFGAQN